MKLSSLLERIASSYDVAPEDVKGNGRNTRLSDKRLINVRHVFSVVAKDRGYNYSEIARFLEMDHSSVQYYVKRRPQRGSVKKTIQSLTDHITMIEETAQKLSDDPTNEYLQKSMLRLLTFYPHTSSSAC